MRSPSAVVMNHKQVLTISWLGAQQFPVGWCPVVGFEPTTNLFVGLYSFCAVALPTELSAAHSSDGNAAVQKLYSPTGKAHFTSFSFLLACLALSNVVAK